MHLQSAIVTSSSSQVIYLAKWPAWLTALRVDQCIFFDDVQFTMLHNLALWMQLKKMLGALVYLVSFWGSWRLSTVYWIYEHSPTYIFLLVTSRWKLLTEINKYWPGCRQLAWFPRHRVLPTHSWTTVTVKLQTFQPHIHLNCRSTSKLSHSIPWIRPQKDALLLSIALSKPHLRTIAPNVFCLSFAMALSNTWNSFLSK